MATLRDKVKSRIERGVVSVVDGERDSFRYPYGSIQSVTDYLHEHGRFCVIRKAYHGSVYEVQAEHNGKRYIITYDANKGGLVFKRHYDEVF